MVISPLYRKLISSEFVVSSLNRYVIPGIVIIIIVAVSALYLSQESTGGLSDSPQITEDTSIALSLSSNTTISPSDTAVTNDMEHIVDEDGTRHYSLSASDSPALGN